MDLTAERQGDLCQMQMSGAPDRTDLRYVWDFWDGEVRTTVEPAVDKVINRVGSLPIVVTVVGSRGQSQQYNFTVAGLSGPQFTGLVMPTSSIPFPRTVSLAAESVDPYLPITGIWTDINGNQVGAGPYLRTQLIVQEDELTYTATDNIGTIVKRPFNVTSQVGVRPTVGEIGIVVSAPVDGGSFTNVDASFMQNINMFGRQPVAVGPLLPPTQTILSGAWTPILSGVAIVGGQLSNVSNGVYNVDSAILQFPLVGSGALTITNPILLPNQDINGVQTAALITAKLTQGKQFQISNSTGYLTLQALEVTPSTAGTSVGWLNVETAGTLNPAEPANFATQWSSSSLPLTSKSLWYDVAGKTYYQAELDQPQEIWVQGLNGVEFYEYDLNPDLTPGKQVQFECGVQCQVAGCSYTWTLPDGAQISGNISDTLQETLTFQYTIPTTFQAGNLLNVSLSITDPRYPSLPVTRLASLTVASS